MKLGELTISETAIAAFGDWELTPYTLTYMSPIGIDRYHEHIAQIKTPLGLKELYKTNSTNQYIVSSMVEKNGEKKFEINMEITFSPMSIPNHSDKYMNVDGVKVPIENRCKGMALIVYRYFVKQLGFKILGDEVQYFGARRLWSKLSKLVDVQVDIVDITNGNYLEKNVVLHHGTDDWDFDDRVWSYETSKKNRRLILIDMVLK